MTLSPLPFLSPRRPRAAFLLAGLGALLFLAACGGEDNQEGEEEGAPIPAVEVVQAKYGPLPLREQLSGTVRATGQVQVYPESSGQLVSVTAQNGDFVRQGQVLARINSRGSRAQLSQAQASLESARAQAQQAQANLQDLESQLERTETLAEKGMASQQQLESQRAQVESARASARQAQAQVQQAQGTISERADAVGQTVVRAPISGRVGQRNAEVGMQAGGQTPLFTIGNLEQVRVEVPVTQEMLGRIREGQPARITASGLPDSTVTAEVSRISPFLESGTYSAEAEIDVDNTGGRLRPGMYVDVEVSYGESEQATLVPTSALYESPTSGRRGVWLAPSLGQELQPRPADDSEGSSPESLIGPVPMRFQPIEVVAEGGQVVGVRGIDEGTWIVVVGQHLLENGSGPGSERQGPPEARVRPILWSRVVDLQRLQQEDLLRRVMEAQQQRNGQLSSARAPDSSATDDGPGGQAAGAWQADSTVSDAL